MHPNPLLLAARSCPQAELKRVYTQLEVLKTKVMRRDNPHISKRRGGRKPGHRKFSLQAFHNRHSSSSEHQNSSSAATNSQAHQTETVGSQSNPGSEQAGLLAAGRQQTQQPMTGTSSNQYMPAPATGAGPGPGPGAGNNNSAGRLPALAELDGEASSSYSDQRSCLAPLQGARGSGTSSGMKHVRVDDTILEYADARAKGQAKSEGRQLKHQSGNQFKASSLTSKLIGKATRKQQNSRAASSRWKPELPSTSSLGLDDETIMAMNDSQSSGEITPQHRQSIVFGSSSYQADQEPSSVN